MKIFRQIISRVLPAVFILPLALTLVQCNEDEETLLPSENHTTDSLGVANDDTPIATRDSAADGSITADSMATDTVVIDSSSVPNDTSDTVQHQPADTNSAQVSARERVIQDYEKNYVGAKVALDTWNGRAEDCQAGDLPSGVRENVLKHINYFRRQVGLNDDIYFSDEKNAKCQAAALMMHANGDLDHSPPEDWKCYSIDGAKAASKSNLAGGVSGQSSISVYIKDYGSSNKDLGHRRWILYSQAKEMGFGSTNRYNALWVIGGHARNPTADSLEYIVWPPAGHVIDRLVYDRWSLSIPKANFSESKVTMQGPEGTVVLSTHLARKGYGDNTIMWEPEIQKPTRGEDVTYRVSVSDVMIDGVVRDFSYDVIIIGY